MQVEDSGALQSLLGEVLFLLLRHFAVRSSWVVYLFCTFIFVFAIGVFGFFLSFFSLSFSPFVRHSFMEFALPFCFYPTGFAFSSEIFLIVRRLESSTGAEFQYF